MTTKPNRSASAAYCVLVNITGPEPVQKWRTTTTAGRAVTVVGTYSNICRPVGLGPKLVTCCSDDDRAAAGTTVAMTLAATSVTAPSRVTSAALAFTSMLLSHCSEVWERSHSMDEMMP